MNRQRGDMTTYIGLLRAVNLGAHNKVGMTELRGMLTALGLKDVRSLLQSGNVVFRSDRADTAELEGALEIQAGKRLALATEFFVRSASEWKAIVSGNPFPEQAKRDPGHLVAMILKQPPNQDDVTSLQKGIAGRELIRADRRCAYIVYPDGIGRSRLTTAVIEKKLGTRGTARNWNTVLKLLALADGS